jgi:hypothetical protein
MQPLPPTGQSLFQATLLGAISGEYWTHRGDQSPSANSHIWPSLRNTSQILLANPDPLNQLRPDDWPTDALHPLGFLPLLLRFQGDFGLQAELLGEILVRQMWGPQGQSNQEQSDRDMSGGRTWEITWQITRFLGYLLAKDRSNSSQANLPPPVPCRLPGHQRLAQLYQRFCLDTPSLAFSPIAHAPDSDPLAVRSASSHPLGHLMAQVQDNLQKQADMNWIAEQVRGSQTRSDPRSDLEWGFVIALFCRFQTPDQWELALGQGQWFQDQLRQSKVDQEQDRNLAWVCPLVGALMGAGTGLRVMPLGSQMLLPKTLTLEIMETGEALFQAWAGCAPSPSEAPHRSSAGSPLSLWI